MVIKQVMYVQNAECFYISTISSDGHNFFEFLIYLLHKQQYELNRCQIKNAATTKKHIKHIKQVMYVQNAECFTISSDGRNFFEF